MKRLSCFVVLLCLFMPTTGAAQEITIVSDCWKPYICGPSDEKQGIAVDIAREVFNRAGFTVKFAKTPWNRGILDTRNGVYDGIICATKNDAPDFVYPEEYIALQKTCFFVSRNSHWIYNGMESLEDVTLGTIGGYHYSKELDSYIEENKANDNVQVMYGDHSLKQNVLKVKSGRIDTFVEDPAVVQNYITEQKETGLKMAGCVSEQVKLYIPFSPANANSHKYAVILSEGIKALRESGEISAFFSEYGVLYSDE